MNSSVALIPARSGSQRIRNKNVKTLSGHPLIAYSITAALGSGIFSDVICVTDSHEYADIAKHYGAEVPFIRPKETATSTSPDIDWVTWSLNELSQQNRSFEVFSILRPTSPFRTSGTIIRAWDLFNSDDYVHSLRAVSLCTEHPGKMWTIQGSRMNPVLPGFNGSTPWHSSQYASLPEIYVQNASLEIAYTKILKQFGTISGEHVMPFISNGVEGFDINSAEDWVIAEHYAKNIPGSLPSISIPTFFEL